MEENKGLEIPKQVRDDGGKHIGLPVQAAGPVELAKSVGFWAKVIVELTGVFKDAWKYMALIFAGIIAGLVYSMKQIQPVQNIQAEEFINEQSPVMKVNKIKQKGENLSMEIRAEMTGREIRQERRTKRRSERKGKKDANSVLSEIKTNDKI